MPFRPVEVLTGAGWDARRAREWYEARNTYAGAKFLEQWREALRAIEDAPERWPSHLYGTRRFRLRRFPYSVIYVVKSDRIQVVACQHAKRDPEYWRDRIK